MDKVRFCGNCGKLLEDAWHHCPWCGDSLSREEPDWDSVVDDSLKRTEEVSFVGKFRQLEELCDRLEILESELDAFLAKPH